MIIYLAADHAGFELKKTIKTFLEEAGHTVEDCGAHQLDPLDDYPDFISVAAEKVSKNPQEARAIIFGGSGQGEAMLANRYAGVRATVYYAPNTEIVELSRQHNDANVLSIGARFIDPNSAIEAIELWLKTEPLSDEKYARRVKKAEYLTREQ